MSLKTVVGLLALLVAFSAASAQSGGPQVMYMASVRWLDYLPIYCEVVLSATDKQGNVQDIGTIIPSIWCEDIYYPNERQSAVSADGVYYYYAVTNAFTQQSVLYTFNTQNKQVTQVSIPYTVPGNNGQALRSLRWASEGVLVGAYGNVAGWLNTTTGQMTKKVNVWPLTLGCNATKYSGSDLDYNNVYIQCIGLNKAKPCQYIFGLNTVTGRVTPGVCMPANRGIADIIGYIGGWNASYVITINANTFGPNVGLVNPATGQWGETFDTFQTFVDHKMQFNGAGKAVWDKPNKLMYMDVILPKKANAEGIVSFDIANKGHLVYKKPFTSTATWEGFELIPNPGH